MLWGHGCAGANPAIRLALLSQEVTTDPGCYQLIKVLMDFQRFLRKHPTLLEYMGFLSESFWRHFLFWTS